MSDTRSTFAELGLSDDFLGILDSLGYETPTPIQIRTIPALLEGRDLVGKAPTGTGKTAAFALPALTRLSQDGEKPTKGQPKVLVLTPTRELAIQVAEAFQRYAKGIAGFRVLPIYGGQAYAGQLRQLRRGVHVVVGTPGRILDHMSRGTLDLSRLSVLVLDEADEMLRMGFVDDVEKILETTPSDRQTALFSATLAPAIRRIAHRHLNDPVEVALEQPTTSATTIRQRYWKVSGLHKLDALTRLLEAETFDGMIIFVRTKIATTELTEKLIARGFDAAAINGDLGQAQRERAIEQLRKGKLDILVATDVAARGLDVDRVSHVINFDIPYDTDAYVHRIGRTGRAGRQGEAILFVAPRERRLLLTIEQVTGQRLERMSMPTPDVVNQSRIARFEQRITETLAEEEWQPFQEILADYQSRHDVPALEIAAALAKLLQGGAPFLLSPDRHYEQDSRSGGFQSRNDRGPRDRGPRDRGPRDRGARTTEAGMASYRVEVGRNHGLQPGNLVGAIANEAGLEGRRIGRIDIHDSWTQVDLPAGMPKEIFHLLEDVRVCGQPLRISRAGASHPGGAGSGKSAKELAARARRSQEGEGDPAGDGGPPSSEKAFPRGHKTRTFVKKARPTGTKSFDGSKKPGAKKAGPKKPGPKKPGPKKAGPKKPSAKKPKTDKKGIGKQGGKKAGPNPKADDQGGRVPRKRQRKDGAAGGQGGPASKKKHDETKGSGQEPKWWDRFVNS